MLLYLLISENEKSNPFESRIKTLPLVKERTPFELKGRGATCFFFLFCLDCQGVALIVVIRSIPPNVRIKLTQIILVYDLALQNLHFV